MSPAHTAPALLLRPLVDADEREARQAHAELLDDGFDFLLAEQPGERWSDYVERLEAIRHGFDLTEGYVPATFLVAAVEGRIVGRVSVRHDLTPWLSEVGGHIGFGVRPAWRRRGYATEILRLALRVAREAGVGRALVTCDDGNEGSAAAIEACGGRFERMGAGEGDDPPKRRYWITT